MSPSLEGGGVELGITKEHYRNLPFSGDFLVNPYKHDDVLLVPLEILHKLPVAESWEDIDFVVSRNSALRAEMNPEVISEWKKNSASERKEYIRSEIFKNKDACKRILAAYRSQEPDAFNYKSNPSYSLTKLM